jgi:MerR family transcriptional regulator, repressor of the yfmOP operon
MGGDLSYTVDEVIRRLGITSRTLRYYEEIGLLSATARTGGGHRLYDEQAIEKLSFILKLKESLNSPLEEIKSIMELETSLESLRSAFRKESQGHQSNQAEVTQKLDILNESIQLLDELVKTVQDRVDKLRQLQISFEERVKRAHDLKSQLMKSLEQK